MANVDRPNGLRPAKSLVGTPWTALVREYNADASRSTTNGFGNIYIGDPVTLEADGNVTVAASGDEVLGVAVAVGKDSTTFGATGYYNADDLGQRYLAADTAGVVGVVPAELCLFEIQSASDLDLSIGALADVTTTAGTAHGSATTGFSSCELTTASNNDVKVVEFVKSPDNDTTLANARYLVKFQDTEHALD